MMTLSPQQQNNTNAKLAFLLKTLSQGVQECDLRGQITYSNKAHHQMLAYQEGDIVGHYIWDFI